MNRMTITALALCIAPVPACAETAADSTAGSTAGSTDTVIISALRTPVDQDRVASSVTVIDAQAIAAAQPVALTDVLARVPGISVARNGGYGQVTSLRIRGADGSENVMVIDGMRLTDASAISGGFDFSQAFADDIARIEVLRGPQSILWGSNALGGIVNVTTVVPTRALQGDFSVEAGSHQTVNAHAGLGGTSPLIDWRVSGSAFASDGIPTLIGGTQANGYTRQAASGTITVHLAPAASIDLRGFWDNAQNGFSDPFSPPAAIYGGEYALTRQWSGYAGLNLALADGRFRQRLSVQRDQTDNEDVDPRQSPALTYIGHGRTTRYEYQGTLDAGHGVDMVFGAEREEQHMRVGSPYDAVQPYELFPESASINSIYGEARVTPVTGLTLNGGVRHDHHTQFGGNTVFSAGGVYTPDAGTTLLRASYDEGFKAPSLYQLYSDYGSTALQPEHAHGWEAGVERSLLARAVRLGAVWWTRRSTDLIGFAYCPDPVTPAAPPACRLNGYGYYANVAAAQGHGLELTAQAHLGRLTVDANDSLVVNQDRTPGAMTYGMQLPRVPRHLFNATLGYALRNALTASVAARRSGAAFDTVASNVVLPAYTLIDARIAWQVAPQLTLFGRIENLADKPWQTAAGYNSLGRTATLGLRGHF